MKTFIAMLSLLTVLTAQASVSPKVLVGLESRMDNQRYELEVKVNSANTEDIVEGKIVASIMNMVEAKLATAQKMFDAISSEDDLTEENIAAINAVLDQADLLIQEI